MKYTSQQKKDFKRYGTTKYLADIHFYDFPANLTIQGKDITVTKSMNPIRVAPQVINYPDLDRWSNEMYNVLFDGMEGTDWDKVIDIVI